jgi:dipeptidyl aminopeptidase/acylaminoacyl peptidase
MCRGAKAVATGAVVLACACLAGPAAANLAVKNGHVAYNAAAVGKHAQVFTRNLSGSETDQLTDGGWPSTNPAYSPDGRSIVFTKFRPRPDGSSGAQLDLWEMNADGTDVHPLTTDEHANEDEAAFSLDGYQIAYATDTGIWVMNADGSNQHQVADIPGRAEYGPAFSPDGMHIAFEAELINNSDGEDGIFVVDLSTGNVDQLTRVTGFPAFDMSPSYSPDGQKIAFNRSVFDGNAYGRIYLMNPDGSDLHPITDLPQNIYDPTWSADGSQLIFQDWEGPMFGNPSPPGPFLYVVNRDGSDPHMLNDSDGSASPSWQRRVLSTRHGCSGPGHPIAGASGPNLLRGTDRSDFIEGKNGNDDISGNDGSDTICAGPGFDLVSGNAHNDTLIGGPNRDRLDGGAGDDRILARDGEIDRVSCGPGDDTAILDQVDVIEDATAGQPNGSCETVQRQG